jgi:predicted enzyme related to lactoylglutathione lyase
VPPTRLFDFTSRGVSITGGIQHKPEEDKTGTPPAGPGGTLVYWLVEDLGKIAEVIEKAGGKMVGSEEPVREGESLGSLPTRKLKSLRMSDSLG